MHIQISNLFKEYQGNQVLSDISLTFSYGERVGIIGKNGSGKSTLLKILAGIDPDYTGAISTDPKDISIGYLSQEFDEENGTVWDFVSLYDVEKSIASLLQFRLSDYAQVPIAQLSLGQKTALSFVKLSIEDPDVVLLDEPTNHLDTQMLSVVKNWILNRKGITLLVSHNRKFLDETVTKIIELKDGHIRSFGGNYSFYKEQVEFERERQKKDFEVYQKKVSKRIEEVRLKRERSSKLNEDKKYKRDNSHAAPAFFANRASKKAASVVRSVSKNLERLEEIEKPEEVRSTKFYFITKSRSSETVLVVKNLSKSFGEKVLFKDLSFSIQYKDRIVLTGANGSGKSTFINILLKNIEPDTGIITYGSSVKIGYMSQDRTELDFDKTVQEELFSLTEEEIHRSFAQFLLSQEYLTQKCGDLSSGERAKVILIKLLSSDVNFLILDEPTNHLDISSIEGVEEALKEYQGTLLLVSHDEYFREKVGITKTIEL
jgi:macrolide transport system ATP-binding/permease protein